MAVLSLDTREIADFLKSFGTKLEQSIDTKKAVADAAALVASLIKKRTLAGRDVNLKPFTPYISGSSGVDLSSSGEMLDSIEVRLLNENEAVVGIFDPVQERKAIIHQLGLGNVPQRRFFGLSESDEQTMRLIFEIFAKEINKAVQKV